MFSLKKLADRIYLLRFETRYDLAMTFMRYQEFYESPNSRFRGKPFTIASFTKWYTHEYGDGKFTYVEDWAGFNFPVAIIDAVWDTGIEDPSHYDHFMRSVAAYVKDDSQNDGCYLIGSSVEGPCVVTHEVAHALYFTDPEYKKRAETLIQNFLPSVVFEPIADVLRDSCYTETVLLDEIQAYCVEGYIEYLWPDANPPKPLEDLAAKLQALFQEYAPELDLPV